MTRLVVVVGTMAALGGQVIPASVPASAMSTVAHGTPVPNGRYPFAVQLTMTKIPRTDGTSYDSACSAALVSAWWIITAGHCFHDVDRNPLSGPVPYTTTATLGRSDLSSSTGAVVSVVSVVQSSATDLALAKLARPVKYITPLPLARVAPHRGDVVTIAGWGSTTDVDPAPSTHLQSGRFTVSSITATTVGVVGYRPSRDTSACLYDSGAPYFSASPHGKPALVGVESTGPACPHTTEETTSRVDNLFSWIHSVICGNGGSERQGLRAAL